MASLATGKRMRSKEQSGPVVSAMKHMRGIVMALHGYYDNIFRETKASWPKVWSGLKRMRELYPDSVDIMSEAALLATQAHDRDFAKEMFDQIGDR